MNRFNTLLFEVALKGNVEIRGVDADKNVRLKRGKAAGQIGADMQKATQSAQYLHDTHHRQLFHLVPGLAALGLHQRACHADKAGIGHALLERTDKTGTKNIAGGFSGDQGNRKRTIVNH